MNLTPSYAVGDGRFAFAIDGNPTSTANKLKALGGNGPLMIATDHVLAALLPGALDDGEPS